MLLEHLSPGMNPPGFLLTPGGCVEELVIVLAGFGLEEVGFLDHHGSFRWAIAETGEVETGVPHLLQHLCPLRSLQGDPVRPLESKGKEANIEWPS
jgi:hypothetical protein